MFRLRISYLMLTVLLGLNFAQVLADSASEAQIKAAFLYKFAQYTEWAVPASERFAICVLGNDPFEGALQKLDGKTFNNTSVVTLRTDSLDDVKNCQVLFLSPSNSQQLKQWQASLRALPILTVSDDPDAWDYEVMIVLTTEPNRIGFNINRSAARKVGIDFRAQLLQLARNLR